MKSETSQIAAGTTVQMENGPLDCPTLYADGVNGIALTENIVKIHFIEQVPVDHILKGRHTFTMVIPKAEFSRIVEVLNGVAGQIALLGKADQ